MPTKPILNVFTMQTGINTKKVVFSLGVIVTAIWAVIINILLRTTPKEIITKTICSVSKPKRDLLRIHFRKSCQQVKND